MYQQIIDIVFNLKMADQHSSGGHSGRG